MFQIKSKEDIMFNFFKRKYRRIANAVDDIKFIKEFICRKYAAGK